MSVQITKLGADLLKLVDEKHGRLKFTCAEFGNGHCDIPAEEFIRDNPVEISALVNPIMRVVDIDEIIGFGSVALLKFTLRSQQIKRDFKCTEVGIYARGLIEFMPSESVLFAYWTLDGGISPLYFSSTGNEVDEYFEWVVPVALEPNPEDIKFFEQWKAWRRRRGNGYEFLTRGGCRITI